MDTILGNFSCHYVTVNEYDDKEFTNDKLTTFLSPFHNRTKTNLKQLRVIMHWNVQVNYSTITKYK